jgi:aspartyl-tRNA(Asn)/glutamyl-tRNA(Gln) amidotransferase subunit A
MSGWERLGIGGLSQGFLSGRLNPSAVLDDALAGIAAIDDDLSAFVAIDADGARRAAAELKRGRWRGQLHGVPIAVKELFDVAHLPATYGSHILAGAVASADAEVIRRLRRAGAVIVGLTRSHEFGWGITTRTPAPGSPRLFSRSGRSATACARA